MSNPLTNTDGEIATAYRTFEGQSWQIVGRPGYAGRGSAKRQERLDRSFGSGRWRIAYSWNGELVSRDVALSLWSTFPVSLSSCKLPTLRVLPERSSNALQNPARCGSWKRRNRISQVHAEAGRGLSSVVGMMMRCRSTTRSHRFFGRVLLVPASGQGSIPVGARSSRGHRFFALPALGKCFSVGKSEGKIALVRRVLLVSTATRNQRGRLWTLLRSRAAVRGHWQGRPR